jgi:hypothetical protein
MDEVGLLTTDLSSEALAKEDYLPTNLRGAVDY